MTIQFRHDDIVKALTDDTEFRYLARGWDAVIRFEQNGVPDDLVLEDGAPVRFGAATDTAWDMRLIGTDEGWNQLLEGHPAALFGLMVGSEDLRLEGDLHAQRAPYGAAIRRLVLVLRTVQGVAPTTVERAEEPFEDTDIAVGRYVRYEVDGVQYRVYYEEAGQGTPLLLQHTAGADSRQWRHFLADPELQAKYRMIAYDLPFHGRSLPPTTGPRWWANEYNPGKFGLMKWVVGLKQALELDRPIVMGISVGGQLTPDLLAHYPQHFRGAVSVNGLYHNESTAAMDNSPFNDPRIPREFFASMMYEVTSPLAPEAWRRETQWIYSSNAAGIYKGDNIYYTLGHDLRVDGHLINTERTPLYAVVGEFDPANGAPGGPAEIAENIPGAKFAVLPGLSHFAMSDDPVRFNAAIKPILDDVDDAASDVDRPELGFVEPAAGQ